MFGQFDNLSVRPAGQILPANAATLIAGQAAHAPGRVAIASGEEEISYQRFDRLARNITARLHKHGVSDNGLVAICLPRSGAMIASALGAWYGGAAYLAIDPAWPDNRIRTIIADADCAALICDEAAAARALAPANMPILLADQNEAVEADAPDRAGGADVLAYVVYTSGSTGQPKGSEITHANLTNLIGWHRRQFSLCPVDRVAHVAGLGFDAAAWEIWPALCAGATLLPAPEAVRTSAAALRDWLIAEAVTVAFVPTVLAEQLITLDWPPTVALRTLLTGGDRLHIFPPANLPFELVNNYGPSECTVVATSGRILPKTSGETLPHIGTPIDGTSLYLLDPEGRPVPDNEPGEIHIAGANVGRGYRGRPDLTAERFHPDPSHPGARMYSTGDIGVRHTDGRIAFVGRVDDQVQVRGFRVEPAEIAAVIARHPTVAAPVVTVTDSGELAAYLVLHPGTAPTASEMHDFLATDLPEAMIPSLFLVIDRIPTTANGKLDRAALPQPADCAELAGAAFEAAATPVEERLIAIVSDVVSQRAIGVDDNFFMIGGHSLLAAQLVLRAGEAFGVELTLRDLFGAPTVRQLAAVVEQKVFALVAAMDDTEALRRVAG